MHYVDSAARGLSSKAHFTKTLGAGRVGLLRAAGLNEDQAMSREEKLVAILPCNDLDAAEAFFARLGFSDPAGNGGDYRMLADGRGAEIHLTQAVNGWLVEGRNPFGLYLYRKNVDELAASFNSELIEKTCAPEHKPWGMYEFSLNGPDGTLVRVGWPSAAFASA
jgi:hypothetical protein